MRKTILYLNITLVTFISCSAIVSASNITVYTDKAQWETDLNRPFLTETFADDLLNIGVSFVSTESGHINPNEENYQDVLASQSQNEPATTWSFVPKTTGYGGNWILGGPGGSGNSLLVYITDPFFTYVGAIPNSYNGDFWGFISDTPFTSVRLIGSTGSQQQNYRLDDMVYSQTTAHEGITEYNGPATCIQCHEVEAESMFTSVHYQWTGPTPNVPNIAANAGKADLGFNTYCGSAISSPRATCASCHVGYGNTPSDTISYKQLANIDCLMCHQDQYQRKLVNPYPVGDFNWDRYVDTIDLSILGGTWLSMDCALPLGCGLPDLTNNRDIDLNDYSIFSQHWGDCTDSDAPCNYTDGFVQKTFTDYEGTTRTWTLPVHDDEGSFQYGPDETAMGITAVEAAQTVHLPTRASCLRCHAYAAGTNCGKRGDLSTASINPPANLDVHMSAEAEGENMNCQACHEYDNHHVLGRGLDLRPNDRHERLTCTTCHEHDAQPHETDEDEGRLLNNHAARVACQSCHIPTYAKLGFSTETERNWENPHWAAGLFGGQGGYKPEELRGSNLEPTYAWFDGTSNVYATEQVIVQNAMGLYEMGEPNGDVNSDGAQIYPMKEHISNSARHDATGQLVPHSTFKFFVTGDFDQAVADGMAYAGLTGGWTLVPVHTYQTINHGVEPSDNALGCGQCHDSLGAGTPRMDLQGEMGYELQAGQTNGNCTICHEAKEVKPFQTIHDIHVKDKGYDCSNCHNFSRPERGLILPN